MPKSEGNAGVYIGGTGHVPIPMYGNARPAAPPPAPRQTGLDWSKHRAPDATDGPAEARPCTTPPCRGCGNQTPVDELRDRYCPVCTAAAEDRFHADQTHDR